VLSIVTASLCAECHNSFNRLKFIPWLVQTVRILDTFIRNVKHINLWFAYKSTLTSHVLVVAKQHKL